MAETSGAGTDATSGVQDGVKDAASQAAEKGKQAVGQAADQARGSLRAQVDQRSTTAGEQIRAQASDIHAVAEQLRQQGKEGPAKVATQAAERADRVGAYLRDSDADRILGDVEDFARRNPWAVIAGGIFVGFAASRMLKASSSDRYYGVSRQPRPALAPTAGVGAPRARTGAEVGNEPLLAGRDAELTGVSAESGTDPLPEPATASAGLAAVAAESGAEPPGSTGGYGLRPEDPARGAL